MGSRTRNNYQKLSRDGTGIEIVIPPSNGPLAPSSSDDVHSEEILNPINKRINIVILDTAQTKFNVSCDRSLTVHHLKVAGYAIHKVDPSSQRLIYRGKLLEDDKILEDIGIVDDGTIVHLFPKPKIVLSSSSDNATINNQDPNAVDANAPVENHDSSTSTAHVPRIVLDADEAQQRSQIVILASHEIYEAQNRVRLLSLMLLVYSFMEFLQLFSKATYVPRSSYNEYDDDRGIPPGDPTDTQITNSGDIDEDDIMSWHNSDYIDLLISVMGLYVAKLGLRATTETTVKLARQYFILLVIVGIFWNTFYFYVTADQEEDLFEKQGQSVSREQLFANVAISMSLPILLWLTCCVRAWQFHELVREAESEAEERMNRLMQHHNRDEQDQLGIDLSSRLHDDSQLTTSHFHPTRDIDLELQIADGRIT